MRANGSRALFVVCRVLRLCVDDEVAEKALRVMHASYLFSYTSARMGFNRAGKSFPLKGESEGDK